MQSAKGKTRRWLVDWDVLPGAGRWENPLMGWASSADYMQGTQLAFPTKEEAIAFAEKQGWDYMVQKPQEPKIPPKNYGEYSCEGSQNRSVLTLAIHSAQLRSRSRQAANSPYQIDVVSMMYILGQIRQKHMRSLALQANGLLVQD